MRMTAPKKLILQFAQRPVTTISLSVSLNLSRQSITRHLQPLRKAGLIHIAKWERGVTKFVPYYSAGKGKDAVKPPYKPKKESDREYRMRNPHRNLVSQATPWDLLIRKTGKVRNTQATI